MKSKENLKNEIWLKNFGNSFSYRDRIHNPTFKKYFDKINRVLDTKALSKMPLRDILMLTLDGYVVTRGSEFSGKQHYDYVKVNGEQMLIRTNVGNVKRLVYNTGNGGDFLKYEDVKENLVLYGNKKIYLFFSPYGYEAYDRDENRNILAEDANEYLTGFATPEPINERFQEPIIYGYLDSNLYSREGYVSDLSIKLSEDGEIELCSENGKCRKTINAEDALTIIKCTGTPIKNFTDSELEFYKEIQLRANQLNGKNFNHDISEFKPVIKGKNISDIQSTTQELNSAEQDVKESNGNKHEQPDDNDEPNK